MENKIMGNRRRESTDTAALRVLADHVTPAGIERFLTSDYVEGIGPAYARRLVEMFGDSTLSVLAGEPERCKEVRGLGEARALKASGSLRKLRYPVQLLSMLFSCGVSEMMIDRILGKYRKHAVKVVAEDPYYMVEDVWQLHFHTADKIGRQLGIAADNPKRLQAALVGAVKRYAEEGHLFATIPQALATASALSGMDAAIIAPQIKEAEAEGRLIESRGGLYLPVYYKAEKEGAEKLLRIMRKGKTEVSETDIPKSNGCGLNYTPMQLSAMRTLLESPVAVLTGGPGSGKTTVLRGVIDTLEGAGERVILVAPTGRAAKRMSSLTGREASTIHRILGYRPGEGYHKRQLEADVLIIDEGSMLEQVLFNHLLDAVGPETRVIVVGDADQLPAIGAGDVVRDMIDSPAIPTVRLDENFRQRSGSSIAESAKTVNSGEMPVSHEDGEFMIIPESTTRRIHDRVLSLVADELPREKNLNPTDILVVTPQQIGPLGARQLNADLQQRLNPEGPTLRRGENIFRLGDPVMQTSNAKNRGVYNGESGRIIAVDEQEQTLTVEYTDGNRSTYRRPELGELTLGYATTVHKLQGCEVRNIVFPVTLTHKPLLYRNLLYTGISRASRLCVLVGEEEAVRYAIENASPTVRNSNFRHRLASSATPPMM